MEQTLEQFAKYVVDNMHRATLVNALNISQKIDVSDGYPFIEFARAVNNYVGSCCIGGQTTLFACKVQVLTDKCVRMYESQYNINKSMIIDNFIIEFWEAVNDNRVA